MRAKRRGPLLVAGPGLEALIQGFHEDAVGHITADFLDHGPGEMVLADVIHLECERDGIVIGPEVVGRKARELAQWDRGIS